MDINWFRNKVANVPKYKSPTWQYKVQNMSDDQVMAIYFKFKADGLFDMRRKEVRENTKHYQYTIFDYL